MEMKCKHPLGGFHGVLFVVLLFGVGVMFTGCGGGNNGNGNAADNSSRNVPSGSSGNGTWVSQGNYGLSFTITSLSEPIVSDVGGTVIMPEAKCSGTVYYPGGSIQVDKNDNDPSASTITVMNGMVYLELTDGGFLEDHYITIGGVLYSDNFSDAVLSGDVMFIDVFDNENGYYEYITFDKQ
jgi:hypothetical protein